MIETSLMVNDYPEPPENNQKCFVFKCMCEVEIKVHAEDYDEALQYCNLKECDEYEITSIEDVYDYTIED